MRSAYNFLKLKNRTILHYFMIMEKEDGEIFIYRYFEDEDGEPGLDNIETQEEF